MPGPAFLFVVGAYEFEELEGGRIDVRGEFGDVVFQALQVAKVLRVGERVEGPDGGGCGHRYLHF